MHHFVDEDASQFVDAPTSQASEVEPYLAGVAPDLIAMLSSGEVRLLTAQEQLHLITEWDTRRLATLVRGLDPRPHGLDHHQAVFVHDAKPGGEEV